MGNKHIPRNERGLDDFHHDAVSDRPRTQPATTSTGDMRRGEVKFFNDAKGFGFIRPSEPDAVDVFVHQSAVDRCSCPRLSEGQAVEFQSRPSPKGKGPEVTFIRLA